MALSLGEILAIAWVFNALAILFSIGRYVIRLRVLGSFHWDDLTHLIALLSMTAQTVMITGLYDLIRSVRSYSSHHTTTKPDFHKYLQANVAGTILGFTCFWAVKATFLILYRMLFRVSKSFMRAWWAATAFAFVTYWAVIAGALTQCGGAASHLLEIKVCDSPDSVMLQRKTFIYSCVLNIVSDLTTLAIAFGMVRVLQINRRQKIGLAVLFSLTTLILVFEILRLAMSLRGTGNSLNLLWVSLEASVAIIVSSLPTYNALLHRPKKTKAYTDDSYTRLASSKSLKATNDANSGKDTSSIRHLDEEIPMSVISDVGK